MDLINVRVGKRLKQELKAEAREKGLTTSDIVRQVLEEHVRQRRLGESCYDIAKRVGLIGVFKGGPPTSAPIRPTSKASGVTDGRFLAARRVGFPASGRT